MATQNINIGINVSDNGTAKKTVKNFQEITQAATQAQRAAAGINQPVKSTIAPGGTGGSRMVAALAAPGSSQGMSNEQYGNLRGTAGLTGASGRDFAQQAQGLGGVVRLYATYAANVFAVGAAFRALSGAMDTANLVKGLDQLGAASGTALGTLSKRLVEVTDGAISMREAMESTAKAVSSGMSSENLLRMGKVAKQASQALGVDMADAVNRLTRGITKLEPELLDELGIFTRVDMATQAYAKSVGKSTTAITDFERRMAFANAVLEEGERKFSAIDFETNPYTKLLATLKDVAQVGLEVANTVIAPIVKFLSENPKALAVAIGALGVVLVKQALPAIGQFKASLASAATQAAELSKTRSADALRAEKQLNSLLLKEREDFAQKQVQKLNIAAEQLDDARVGRAAKARTLLDSDFADLAPENIQAIEEEIKKVNLQANKYATQAERAAKAGKSPEVVDSLNKKAEAYKNTAFSAESSLKAEIAYEKATKDSNKTNRIAQLQATGAEKARIASVKQSIVANAAYNGSLIGVRGAFVLMNQELDKSELKLGKFSKGLLLARGSVAAFAGMITTVVGRIGGFLNVIAMVGAAVAFLSSFLSANSKQMSAFSGAVDANDESLLNLGRTLDNINRKPFGQQFNTQSLMASATAINEITSSVGSLISKTLEADKAANGFDRFIDGFKTVWGGDIRTQFAKSISGTVFGTLEKLGDSPEAKKARDSIASIIEVSPNSSRKDWQSAFAAIADNEPKLRLVEQAMKDLGIATAVTAGKAESFDNALKASEDAYKNFTNQFKTSDPLAQLAESLIASGVKTAQAVEVPEMAIARLASVVGDVNKIALFDEQDQKNLLKYGDQIVNANKNFEAQKSAVKASKEEINKLSKAFADLQAQYTNEFGKVVEPITNAGKLAFDQAKKQLDARKEQLNKEQALVASTLVEITTLTARFPNLAAGQLLKGADMLSSSISASLSKGSSAFAEAVLASVGDLPGLAKERESIELRKLDTEARLIKIQTELARATIVNSAELRRASAAQAVETAQASANLGVGSFRDLEAENRLKEAQKTLSELDKSIAIIKVDPSNALAALKTIRSEIASGNKVIQEDAASLFEFVNSLAGLSLQQQNNETAKRVAAYKAVIDGVKEEFKESAKVLANQREENALLIANYALQKARNGSLTETESISAQEAQAQAITLERNQKLLAIGEKLAVLAKAQSTGETALAEEVFQKERGLLLEQVSNVVREAGNKISSSELATLKEIYAEQQRLVAIEAELVAIKKSGTDATQASADKIRDLNNETQKSLGTFIPEYQAQQDALLSLTKVRLQAERDEQALTSAFIERSLRLQAEAAQRLKESQSPEKVESDLQRVLDEEAKAYGNKVIAINSTRDAELDALKQVEDQRKKTESFDTLIDSLKSLDSAWASFGSTLAGTVTAFADLGKAQKQYTATFKDLDEKLFAAKGPEEQKAVFEEIQKTQQSQQKAEIAGYAKVVGASKGMFKEKTFAHKALEKIEKALHLYRMAAFIKENAMDAFNTVKSVANSAVRVGASVVEAGVDGVKAVVKAISSMPFPLNIAAGAATAAVVAGLLKQIGGSSPSVGGGGFVPTAEQRQETQGTGMTWDSSGNKVTTGGGIFGDDTAKANSITNSLEILRDNSFESLTYDNKLLRSFERVADSITGTTNAIISSGIRNIPAALQGLLGSTSSVGKDLGSKILGFLGGSSKSSTSVTSQRLELSGNFLSAAENINSSLKNVATTVTNWSTTGAFGGLFGGNKSGSTVTDNVLALPDDVRDAFNGILDNLRTGYEEIAKVIGKSSSEAAMFVTERLRGVEFKDSQGNPLTFEFKDLKGDELAAELNAFVSQINNISLKNLFPEFDKFKKYGEDFGTTVIKVVQGNRQVDTALRAMGSTFDVTKDKIENIRITFPMLGIDVLTAWTKTTTAFELSETIINKMAGSLERFTDQAKFFIDNFLTESERMANTRGGVNKALVELNLSTNLTRDEFKRLVQIQDLSTQTGRDMYQGLMDIQEGFFKVTQRLEDLKSESINLGIELLKAQGRTQEATAALNAIATEGMNAAELAAYNYNESLKQQIEALKKAETVTNQRISLEQRFYQVTGNTVALRARELNKLDASNQALQLQIWAYEDYTKVLNDVTSAIAKATQDITTAENAVKGVRDKATDNYVAATQKVADAQASIANLAIEAAKKMRDFGKSLREFVSQQVFGEASPQNTAQNLSKAVASALGGDSEAMQSVPELAQQAIDAAKASSKSAADFNKARASILTQVGKAAQFAEQQASLADVSAEEDPLITANKALETALQKQTAALNVANQIGASLIKAPEDLIAQYKAANADLAQAIVDKAVAEEVQRKMQAALNDIAFNTGKLIASIVGLDSQTGLLAKYTEDGFTKLDTNFDGKLTFDELTKGLAGKATDNQIKDLIKAVDLNSDNVITAYELDLVNNTKSVVAALGDGFELLDTNLDGKLSGEEFKKGMTGKASDAALDTIFKLIDADNDTLITANELAAAQSLLVASNTLGTAELVGITATAAAQAGDNTTAAITGLESGNLLVVASNTANTLEGINLLINSNTALFNAMSTVAANTAALANAVQSGSGSATVASSSGGNVFTSIFGKVGGAIGGVLDAVSKAVSSVFKPLKKLFSDSRTKTNVTLSERLSNGINLYDFNYKQPYAQAYGSDRKRGVIAQEVMRDYPAAVSLARNGMYMVDYSKLPIPGDKLKFAKGGVFSNQVVTRPTNFQLAQMGEAGPEAIMPLARTRDGSLGVVAQPGGDANFTGELLVQNRALIDEVRALRGEVNLLRYEARATASSTNKTTRILERVTRDGESLLVTDSATV
jgi:Ca2+-binding EF-hand superfamily protein